MTIAQATLMKHCCENYKQYTTLNRVLGCWIKTSGNAVTGTGTGSRYAVAHYDSLRVKLTSCCTELSNIEEEATKRARRMALHRTLCPVTLSASSSAPLLIRPFISITIPFHVICPLLVPSCPLLFFLSLSCCAASSFSILNCTGLRHRTLGSQ